MAGNVGVAITRNKETGCCGNKAFLIVVENDGYSVEEYPSFEFGVEDFEGCFSFSLENELYFCVQKTLYQFIKDLHTWKKLTYDMQIVRYGTACVSLEHGTIIAGGCEYTSHQHGMDGENPFRSSYVKELKDNCVMTVSYTHLTLPTKA